MSEKKQIQFVCTDNVGRSLTAEFLFNQWAKKNDRDDLEFFSCGTNADSDTSNFSFAHFEKLSELGFAESKHQRTQLTKELFEKSDVVIAMDLGHKDWILDRFKSKVPLFNELYKNESSSVIITSPGAKGTMSERLLDMVEYIEISIPKVVKKLDNIGELTGE